jgi:predicted Zn-dependent peptidase
MLTPVRIRELWARTHQAESMTLVVAGDVPIEVLLASFRGIGAPPFAGDTTEPALPSMQERARPEVIRHWYGEARALPDSWDPHVEVVARLVAEAVRAERGEFEAEVQVWETARGKYLAVVGAAYSRQARAMRQAIRDLLADTEAGLTEEAVRRAVDAVQEELLLGARTPGGRVTLVGRQVDATGEPRAVTQYLGALSAVTLPSVRAFLERLSRTSPVTAEVRP